MALAGVVVGEQSQQDVGHMTSQVLKSFAAGNELVPAD
jgi:hypothetical protein